MAWQKFFLICVLVGFGGTGSPSHAQQPLALFEIYSDSATDPAGTISKIDELMESQSITDRRSLFDLLVLKAELLESEGRALEAALLYEQLAGFANQDREVLQWDPITLLERAFALLQNEGDTAKAEAVILQVLDFQRDGGASVAEIAETFDRLAQITSGETAQQYADAAITARTTAEPTRSVGDPGGYREVEVFYATDRARSGDPRPAQFYSGDRGELELGVAMVTIPDNHQAGALEAPKIWKLEFAPNPTKHVVLQSVTPVAEDAFFANMNESLTALDSSDAFVFVHGYNVRFDSAAKRAAQLAYDMNFPGVPVLYSWPSRGTTIGYIPDTAVVRLSGRRLSGFLDDLVEKSGATTIHIVAHSMGNRALTDALELMALRRDIEPGSEPIFDQVLFAAPDVDAELFAAMMPTIRPIARRLTLYASDEDWALETSKQLHGNVPRAGQGGENMVARPEFDSVDMSELGEDMMAHSYFADDSSAIADMVTLFWRNTAPNRRCGLRGQERANSEVPVWQYVPGSCADSTLVEVMSHLRQAKVTDAKTAEQVISNTVPDPVVASSLLPIVSKLFAD